MKSSVYISGAVVLATTIAAGAALAQRPGGIKGVEISFEEIDLDGNGEISREEMMAVRETRFTRTDLNGDGVLNQEEMIQAGQARMQERVGRMIERYDTDGDGALSLEEMPERGKGRREGRMFDRVDADDNGAISKQEFDEAKAHWAERKSRRHGHN